MYNFDVEKEWNAVVAWTKDWLKGRPAILGLSGGIDSTLTGLIIKAAGSKVIGVMMPCGEQKDIEDAAAACELIGAEKVIVNIGDAFDALNRRICVGFGNSDMVMPDQYMTNTPARIRMTTLYGISAMTGGFVANTCNASETFCGYDTLYGDSAGSFAPIARFTKTEVRALAKYAGAPEKLYNKVSIDGMSLNDDGSYMSDETKLGFTYAELDAVIREDAHGSNYEKIINVFKNTAWKRKIINIEHYSPNLPCPVANFW